MEGTAALILAVLEMRWEEKEGKDAAFRGEG